MLALAGAGVASQTVSGSAAAQTPAPQLPPNPDRLAAAREENRHAAEALARFNIPMSTEPAFEFRP
jgi:hypothetical protein